MNTRLPLRSNDEITARTVGLWDETGHWCGDLSLDVALSHARAARLDLIEFAPKRSPPVCRIGDLSHYATTTLVEDLLSAGHSRDPVELDLIRQYAHLGICSGKYLLLLLPDDAVRFAEDAAERGIGILGPEYWYGPGWEWWPGPDYGALIGAADFVEKSLERVKEDIQYHLPDEVAFVSLTLRT